MLTTVNNSDYRPVYYCTAASNSCWWHLPLTCDRCRLDNMARHPHTRLHAHTVISWQCKGVSNIITRLRLLGRPNVFLHFTIEQTRSNMFCWISQNCEEVFRLNILYGQGGHPTLFWNKQKGVSGEIWHLWPRRSDPLLGASVTSIPRLRPRRMSNRRCIIVYLNCKFTEMWTVYEYSGFSLFLFLYVLCMIAWLYFFFLFCTVCEK